MLVEVEPCEERSSLRWVSPFVYEVIKFSCLVDGLRSSSDYHGIWEFMFCARCIRVASIRSTVVLTTFTSHSTCVNLRVC